jgi:hypothetical protein
MASFRLGNKGQAMSGLSIGYSIFILGLGIFIVGGALIILSENFLGSHMLQIGSDFGADASVLGYFEMARKFLPVVSLLGIVIGMLVMSYINS